VDVVARPISELARAMRLSVVWDAPSADLRIVNGLGQLAPVEVIAADSEAKGPEPGCGWALKAGDDPVVLPVSAADPGLRVLRVAYVSAAPATLELTVDGEPVRVATDLPVGHVDVVTRAPVRRVTARTATPGSSVCLSEVRLGGPWPGATPP
jgi:hypothetical protein